MYICILYCNSDLISDVLTLLEEYMNSNEFIGEEYFYL